MTDIVEVGADNAAAIKFLESFIQSGNLNFLIGSGASSPAIKVAGTIESEINALLAAGKDAEANQKSVQFIEQINKVQAQIKDGTDPNVKAVSERYAEFFACVDRILFARKNILLPRQANLFTTNYDMFCEYAAKSVPTVLLNDGFDRTSGIGTEFVFAPERYFDRTYRSGANFSHQIEIPTINLIKLHGSVSWRRGAEHLHFDPNALKPLSPADKGNEAKVREFLEKHFLILPNLRKFHATLMDRVYYDLLRLFSKAMDQQNVVLIAFGFSFADEHILDITRRSLRNPTSHLIIVAYDKPSVDGYKAKFDKQRNVTILSPATGTQIDFARMNAILNATLLGASDAA